jgi:hypothetical protein
MRGNTRLSLDRRKFLEWGALGGVLLAAGCSGRGGEPQNVTAPPAEGGNRMLLKKTADATQDRVAAKGRVKKK